MTAAEKRGNQARGRQSVCLIVWAGSRARMGRSQRRRGATVRFSRFLSLGGRNGDRTQLVFRAASHGGAVDRGWRGGGKVRSMKEEVRSAGGRGRRPATGRQGDSGRVLGVLIARRLEAVRLCIARGGRPSVRAAKSSDGLDPSERIGCYQDTAHRCSSSGTRQAGGKGTPADGMRDGFSHQRTLPP
jgi:hypothetical protein